MKFGICMFPTDYAMNPAEIGPLLEERDFESLWVAEHTHIPCSRKSPWPGGPELPKMYYDCFAPLPTLAAAGATTKKLKLGTGIQLVAQHDPIALAKEIATLDQITNGRFLFGIGGGWNQEELANHYDVPFKRRWKLMRERIEAMKAIWTDEKAEYHGEFVDFDPIFSWPKPVQTPHPPIHVGGAGPLAIKRALRYGDGWIPLAGRGDADPIADAKLFRTMAKEAGRDPDSMELSLYVAPTDPDELKALRDAGYTRVLFGALSVAGDEFTKIIDMYAEVVQRMA